ncbi:MAG: DEAD/DEAH box helicase, partial [Deltaproteobacteria bacterium]|nr:DEAD/DEAH box helicase [Deltaproteobacteria bacterium]
MSDVPFNPAPVMKRLKDFQRATAEYVFRRLYEDHPPARRFLVADEVGLGKTLVARGVIANALQHLHHRTDRIDIIYICSNAAIARQNIARLNVYGSKDFAMASRLTLL